jgi:hypothetical protein
MYRDVEGFRLILFEDRLLRNLAARNQGPDLERDH